MSLLIFGEILLASRHREVYSSDGYELGRSEAAFRVTHPIHDGYEVSKYLE
jgi:hypothetical protein